MLEKVYGHVVWSMLNSPAQDNNITRLTAISRTTRIGGYQNDTTVDVTGAKDDGGGGDNRHKAPVKSSQPTNQYPTFYR